MSEFPPGGGNMGAMNDSDDMTLLRAWARERSETAFRAVVERYAGLVFGVALRRTGERPLAEEAVQNVFTDLARKAAVVVELQRPLAAWLHRCAVYESATLLRSEIRHREKMNHFAASATDESAPDPWLEVRPFLDDAINALPEPDRRVLLLHWFERRTFAEIAEKTGGNAGAVQRRGLRALDKLAALLRRRGSVIPAVMLAAGLTPQLSHAAPPGLAATVSAAAVHAAPAAGGLTLFIQQSLHIMASAKLTTAVIVLVAAAIPVSVQFASSRSPNGAHKPDGAYANGSEPATRPAAKSGPASDKGFPAALDLAALRRALERARDSTGGSAEIKELARLMLSLELEEIPAVTAMLRELAASDNGLGDVVEACYTRWAELEPDKATAAGFALPPGKCKWHATRAAFETWAAQDFSKAWAWLEATVPGSEWWAAGQNAVRRLTRHDPLAALALLARTNEPEIRKQLPVVIARAWGVKDPEAALAWTQTITDEGERTSLSGKVLESAGEQNPARALALLEKLDNASARGESGWNVLWPWALRAPDEAFMEMTKNGGAWPDRLAYGLGDAMARHDAARAAEAARAMPEGPKRDEFVQGVLMGVRYTDPGAAVSVLDLISDKELMSHGGLNTFVGAWARKDATAAARWLSSLPEDTSHKKEFAASHFQAEAGKSWQEVLKQEGGAK